MTWIKYNPRVWWSKLASVAVSSELAHRRLADMVWADGEWPSSDPKVLGRLVRNKPSALPIILKDLALLGWFSSGGRLQNAKVALVRREAAQVMVSRHVASGTLQVAIAVFDQRRRGP